MLKLTKQITILFLLVFTLSSMTCEGGDDWRSRSNYKPTTMSRADFENSIKMSAPQTMKKAGKIYLKDNYMFIGDSNRGFHIYKNDNPENPVLIAFIEIPGVTDIAIRDDIFYANQAVDLIAFKLNVENQQVQIVKRIPNTFPELVSPDGYVQNVGQDQIVVDWN